jgi:hypothetical protein
MYLREFYLLIFFFVACGVHVIVSLSAIVIDAISTLNFL